jgi:hypothetical protein
MRNFALFDLDDAVDDEFCGVKPTIETAAARAMDVASVVDLIEPVRWLQVEVDSGIEVDEKIEMVEETDSPEVVARKVRESERRTSTRQTSTRRTSTGARRGSEVELLEAEGSLLDWSREQDMEELQAPAEAPPETVCQEMSALFGPVPSDELAKLGEVSIADALNATSRLPKATTPGGRGRVASAAAEGSRKAASVAVYSLEASAGALLRAVRIVRGAMSLDTFEAIAGMSRVVSNYKMSINDHVDLLHKEGRLHEKYTVSVLTTLLNMACMMKLASESNLGGIPSGVDSSAPSYSEQTVLRLAARYVRFSAASYEGMDQHKMHLLSSGQQKAVHIIDATHLSTCRRHGFEPCPSDEPHSVSDLPTIVDTFPPWQTTRATLPSLSRMIRQQTRSS